VNGGSAEGAGFAEGAAAKGECADDTRGQGRVSSGTEVDGSRAGWGGSVGASIRINDERDLEALRARLQAARDHARNQLRRLVDDPNLLARLKFERLGCDPIDIKDSQNRAEQIDQQAHLGIGRG
jgi:hypothetical protein